MKIEDERELALGFLRGGVDEGLAFDVVDVPGPRGGFGSVGGCGEEEERGEYVGELHGLLPRENDRVNTALNLEYQLKFLILELYSAVVLSKLINDLQLFNSQFHLHVADAHGQNSTKHGLAFSLHSSLILKAVTKDSKMHLGVVETMRPSPTHKLTRKHSKEVRCNFFECIGF